MNIRAKETVEEYRERLLRQDKATEEYWRRMDVFNMDTEEGYREIG